MEVVSQSCIFNFRIETLVYGIILGLNQYHIAFNVILEVRENCNCCVGWASRIVRWNVNEGSNACKSLLYEGDCDCRISSSPSLEGKYSEHGSPARRGAPSFRGTSLFVGGDTREGLVKINVARRAELSR